MASSTIFSIMSPNDSSGLPRRAAIANSARAVEPRIRIHFDDVRRAVSGEAHVDARVVADQQRFARAERRLGNARHQRLVGDDVLRHELLRLLEIVFPLRLGAGDARQMTRAISRGPIRSAAAAPEDCRGCRRRARGHRCTPRRAPACETPGESRRRASINSSTVFTTEFALIPIEASDAIGFTISGNLSSDGFPSVPVVEMIVNSGERTP